MLELKTKLIPMAGVVRGYLEVPATRLTSFFLFFLMCLSIYLSLFFFNFMYLFLETGEGKEKERERNMNQLPLTGPNWGPGLQPRPVP